MGDEIKKTPGAMPITVARGSCRPQHGKTMAKLHFPWHRTAPAGEHFTTRIAHGILHFPLNFRK
uniref:Uncharacterized protein n=1 Tax=Candidatus Kentrum sp. MB TaxID=2138164 RepID=A0A450XNB1_9GAMM|nr:MAG: hypothetical protein BECKMB1821I_GA0114274_101827 [Candidatus Kentron sp. MB]VFK75246.1 MAG: hypothetical protein BECKMB1821H_GA0114242_101827 [Candidatus Kentron sp. MB]